jgi:hypothetical protein
MCVPFLIGFCLYNPVDVLSNYQTGAFEALEWTWYMLRSYKNKPSGLDKARKNIQEILANIGNGDMVNFQEQISKIQVNG